MTGDSSTTIRHVLCFQNEDGWQHLHWIPEQSSWEATWNAKILHFNWTDLLNRCRNQGSGLYREILFVFGGETTVQGGKRAADFPRKHRGVQAVGTRRRVSRSVAHFPPKPGLFVRLSALLEKGQRAQQIAGYSPDELFWENILQRRRKGKAFINLYYQDNKDLVLEIRIWLF